MIGSTFFSVPFRKENPVSENLLKCENNMFIFFYYDAVYFIKKKKLKKINYKAHTICDKTQFYYKTCRFILL